MAAPVWNARIRRPLALALALASLLGQWSLPAAVHADWRDFVPAPSRNSLVLDAGATLERDEAGLGGQRSAKSDIFFKEKLSLVSDGFSYHPRFIQYHLLLATALKQETFKNDGLGAVDSSASALDYDLRLNILPEHPYKLTLFSSRTEPLYKQYLSADADAVTVKSGAVFSYRKKPFFLNLRYIDSSRTWAGGSSDLGIAGVNGQYFKEFGGGRRVSFTSFYDHAASRLSSGSLGSAENYGASNTIDLNASSLQSTISKSISSQDAVAGGLARDGFSWLERLNLRLPLHFRSLLTYRYQKHDQTIAPEGASAGEARSVSNRNYELDIIHNLYRSLETTYRLRRDVAASADGETATTSNSLAANYTKSVPRGTFFAGANLIRSETDSAGQTAVADETHEGLGLNEVFTALRSDADCGSIRVFLTDHAAGDRLVPVDFIAVPSAGARCDIMVTGIPPDFDETARHDYSLSYRLESGDYTLRTDSYGYNASLNLFHNNLNPYYSHTVTSADLLAGSHPGNPFDGTVTTAGLVLGSLPWRLLGEYQRSDGRANSFRRWRGEINCNQAVTTTTNVALMASHTRTDYPEGSTAGSPQAYTDNATRLSANLQQRLFRRNLVLSGGGSYTIFEGLMKSSGYSLHASLQWKIGRTTITAGANGYRSRRDGLSETDSERARQYYYLNLRREIF